MSALKIGVAQIDYNPELGLPLMGNFREDYAARGIHDPLKAKAIVVKGSNGVKAALVAIDTCMMDCGNIAQIREIVASQCDISPENVFIASTHTHSAPATSQFGTMGAIAQEHKDAAKKFLKKAAGVVKLAEKNLKDSKLSVGYSTENRVSFNRRLKCKDGKTHMNWEGLDPDFVIKPWGNIDPQLISVSIEQKGKLVAALVNFALHPAVLCGDNWLYSADYPGYLSEALAKVKGQDFITLFFNGCCGNVNHIDYSDKLQGRGYQMTQRIGYMLGIDTLEAMNSQKPVKGDKVMVSKEFVSLKRLPVTEEKYKWALDVMEKIKTNPTAGQVDGLPDEYYATIAIEMYKKQNEDDQVEVMAIRIGDIGIVGIPGETFNEFGIQIKKKSPAKHTIVIELANDSIGYLPTKAAFEQGGYEPSPGSTLYLPGAGDKIVKSAVNQLKKLFS